jgi:protein-disulfide isomerase
MNTSSALTPIAIIIAGALIAGGLYFGLGGTSTTNTGGQQPVAVNADDVATDGLPFIGQADAPLTIAFWSDFQCPFCKAVETGGIPQIPTPAALPDVIKQYVDTGKVRIVFKDFAFLGNDSMTAAEYGRAVWKLYPTQYFAWRTAMYDAQDEEGDQGFGDEPSIVTLTKTIAGIDASAVQADVAAHKADYDKAIAADITEGQSMGVQGTPAFIIGTQFIDGAQAFDAFKAAIDAQL